MSTVYFAKFNINEKIYDVYEKKESLDELLSIIYQGMSSDLELTEVVKKKEVNYKFIQLNKDPETLVVNGRIVAFAPGTHITYNREKDDVIETSDDSKATYITFSFDIKSETIGFVPKFDFGRKQFLDRFKSLIEKSIPEVGEVEIFLETDLQALNEKIEKFKHIDEVSLSLIPPNNDKELFEELFGIEPEKLNKTGGTKFLLQIKGTAKKGLDITSEYLKNLIKGVSLGYGYITLKGRNTSDEDLNVKSDKDAPYIKGINDNNKDSMPAIEEKTRAGVSQLHALKAIIKETKSG